MEWCWDLSSCGDSWAAVPVPRRKADPSEVGDQGGRTGWGWEFGTRIMKRSFLSRIGFVWGGSGEGKRIQPHLGSLSPLPRLQQSPGPSSTMWLLLIFSFLLTSAGEVDPGGSGLCPSPPTPRSISSPCHLPPLLTQRPSDDSGLTPTSATCQHP